MRTLTSRLGAALALLVLAGPVAGPVAASTPDAPPEPVPYIIDQAHTQVQFKVKHLGITTVTGSFHDFDVDLVLDPADVSTLETRATVNTTSIDTGIERRDNHLRSPDFFESETYPTMTFESRGVRNVEGSRFELVGDLTIRGVTKPVAFDVEMAGPVADMEGKERVAFTASTRINRRDFGLEWNRAVEGVNVVSDDVDIVLDIQAVRADA